MSPGGGDGSPRNPAGGARAVAAWREVIRGLRAHHLRTDAEGRCMTPVGGWAGQGGAGRGDRGSRSQGPGRRPRIAEAAGCPGRGRWGSGDRGGWPGPERGAGHALVGRLGRGAAGALESGAGTRGRRACCRYARAPDGGDTGFSLRHRASSVRVGRSLVTRPHPGVDFPTKAHQGHCSLSCKVAWLRGRVSLEWNAIRATAGRDTPTRGPVTHWCRKLSRVLTSFKCA